VKSLFEGLVFTNWIEYELVKLISLTEVEILWCFFKNLLHFINTLQVVLVGLVRSANETTTRLDYTVDDMTGPPLEVRQFVDNDVSTAVVCCNLV
jgi:hypothetical protein